MLIDPLFGELELDFLTTGGTAGFRLPSFGDPLPATGIGASSRGRTEMR